MEQTIKCCDYFGKIRHLFEWFKYNDTDKVKVLCMPYMVSCDGVTKIRINHCPSCGKEVRNIELREKLHPTSKSI